MSPEGSQFLFKNAPRGLDRKRLRRFQQRMTAELAGGRSFNCLLTTDAELRNWNLQFLGKDYATDVLSFPSDEPQGSLGDMAISAARAAEQAADFGHSIETEIEVLMLHGALHLMGHDHETDRGAMRGLERRWRETFGLPAGLIERAGK